MRAVVESSCTGSLAAPQFRRLAGFEKASRPSTAGRRRWCRRAGLSRSLQPFQGATVSVRASAEPLAQSTTSASTAAGAALLYTSYEGNSWRVEFQKSGVKVLVDPWLVGRLEFAGQTWLYSGSKRVARPETIDIDKLAVETDFILLTQSIDDHAHKPTLQRLPKSLPVVASPSAAQVARGLGFKAVTEVDHGQEVSVCDGRLRVRGTAGALVGPPWSKRENGFVLSEAGPGGVSLYYEPHCDFDPASLRAVAPVDVVVTPPASQILLGYPLVKGATDNGQLLGLLRPKVVVPLLNAEFDQAGPLAQLLEEQGSVEALQALLAATPGLQGVKVCVPSPGQPMPVVLS